MVIDSSAVVAILKDEPEAQSFIRAIANSQLRLMSAGNLLEAGIVLDNLPVRGADRRLDRFVRRAGIVIEPVTEAQVAIARQAYAVFGRGNFGDCVAYALSKDKGEPLLFKGEDFARTDVDRAAP